MIKKIVLTGGPCAGKTTALTHIKKHLQELGYHVMVVPEVATLLIPGCDLHIPSMDKEQTFEFDEQYFNLQIAFEDSYVKLAKTLERKTVIICDRGCMDVFAFISDEMGKEVLERTGHKKTLLRDFRYDAVIHMSTAADGAEEFYTLDNNEARTETPEQAKAVCQRLKEKWLGHSKLFFVNNPPGGFEEKLENVIGYISKVINPAQREIERKFLIDVDRLPNDLPVVHESFEIFQDYLENSEGKSQRTRERQSDDGYVVLTHTSKSLEVGNREEIERQVSSDEFAALSKKRDKNHKTIIKTRKTFLHKGLQLELDIIRHPKKLVLLEIEVDSMDQTVYIPDWLPVIREVTTEKAYYNKEISKGS